MARRKAHIVNWQERAKEFSEGDVVYPFAADDEYVSGRVVQVFPGIGMADVEYPNGTKRHPVEELQRVRDPAADPPKTENVPGGAGTVSVPGGPKVAAVDRVARAFVKRSLYWASKDRKYKATFGESGSGDFGCPKCREAVLRNAVYKRADGVSDRLLGCPNCLFLIKKVDIIGHPDYEQHQQPFSRIRLAEVD